MSQPQSSIRNRLLKSLPPSDFALLAPHLEPVTFTLHDIVAQARAELPFAFFIESGVMSFLAKAPDERVEVGMAGREGMIGAAGGFGATHTPYMILCQGDAETFKVSADQLRTIARQSSILAEVLGLYLYYLTTQIGQTSYANVSLNIEARLARWILMTDDRQDGFELSLTHEFMATMLGTRRPGVTTALHVLEGAGTIRAERGIIIVRDRAKLEELSDGAYGLAEAEYKRLFGQV